MDMLMAIAGPSCSGKTTLARIVARILGAPLLHLDRRWMARIERPVVNGHQSFERPEQYDGAGLLDETMRAMECSEHVVVEGFLLFTYPGFHEAADRRILLDVPHEVVARRRLERAQAKAALDDVAGGRSGAADAGWQAHGREEWDRFGAWQRDLPGMEVVTHDMLGNDVGGLDRVARDILGFRLAAKAA